MQTCDGLGVALPNSVPSLRLSKPHTALLLPLPAGQDGFENWRL